MPPYSITHWDRRTFALYDGDDLLAVTLYKKGAARLRDELVKRDTALAQHAAHNMESTHEHQAS